MANSPKNALLTVEDYDRLPVVPADHRLTYGSHPIQFGDLYMPAGSGPHPVVVMVHGGCWRERWGLEGLGLLCTALAKEGLAVWSLEYRRLGNGGGWPTTFTDVAAGADFLRRIAGQWNLDLSRAISAGHSAGGHLALWLAGRHRLPQRGELFSADPLPLRGAVSLAGIADLAEGVKRNICEGSCHELVGGMPDAVPGRYEQASPSALLPLGVPQWHVVGSDDDLVPADYVQRCAERARRYDDVRLDVVPHAGHFEIVVPTTHAWAPVRNALVTLLQ
ncbi:MAG: alpha/beta hydrolase family protein [Candidatus Binatia bacterium]